MELLMFILILFTIVFVIYLCGHITETLEEIKIVRTDLSNYYNEVSEYLYVTYDRINTVSTRLDTVNDRIDTVSTRLDDISNQIDELAGEDVCDVLTLDNGKINAGLYEFDEDTIKMCFGQEPSDDN